GTQGGEHCGGGQTRLEHLRHMSLLSSSCRWRDNAPAKLKAPPASPLCCVHLRGAYRPSGYLRPCLAGLPRFALLEAMLVGLTPFGLLEPCSRHPGNGRSEEHTSELQSR